MDIQLLNLRALHKLGVSDRLSERPRTTAIRTFLHWPIKSVLQVTLLVLAASTVHAESKGSGGPSWQKIEAKYYTLHYDRRFGTDARFALRWMNAAKSLM